MIKRHLALAVGILGGLCILVGAVILWPKADNEIQVLGSEIDVQSEPESADIVIDVSGAVNKPGVYSFHYGKRIADALEAAGGLSNHADTTWVDKKLNKSEKLKDGMKLYIPSVNEQKNSGSDQLGLININESGQSELESLSGIGAATAKKIITGRPYARLEELVEKKIVGQKVFDQIQNQLGL